MPGLSQLKKFSTDMMNLGNEVAIRAARGEKPSQYTIPATVEDVDDSEDFRLGLPELSEEEQQQADAAAAEREREANDFSDITGGESEEGESSRGEAAPSTPDVSDLLAPSDDIDLGDLDLSEFEEPEPEPEPVKPKEIPLEDMDLDALLALSAKPEPEPQPAPEPPKPAAKPARPAQTAQPQQPAQVQQPARPTQTAQPARPAQPQQAAKPAQPQQAAKPAQPQQAAKPARPAQTAQPQQPARPTQTAQPAKPAQVQQKAPVQPPKPAQPAPEAKTVTPEPELEPLDFALPDFDQPSPQTGGIQDDLATLEEPLDFGFPADDMPSPQSEPSSVADDVANFGFPKDDMPSPQPDAASSASGSDDFDSFAFDGSGLNMNEGLPGEVDEGALKESSAPISEPDPFSMDGFETEEYKAPESDDFAMPDFDTGTSAEGTSSPDDFAMPDFDTGTSAEGTSSPDDFVMPDFDAGTSSDSAASPESEPMDFGFGAVEEYKAPEPEAQTSSLGGVKDDDDGIDFDIDSVSEYKPPESTGDFTNPDNFTMPDFDRDEGSLDSDAKKSPSVADFGSSGSDSDPFSMDGFGVEEYQAPASDTSGFDTPDNFTMPDMDSASDTSSESSDGGDPFSMDGFNVEEYQAPSDGAGSSDASDPFAVPDFDAGGEGGADSFGNDAFGGDFGLDEGASVPDATESVEDSFDEGPAETFDTSGMDGVDFSSGGGTDFEMGSFGDSGDDFAIPGFSDTVGTADLNKNKPDVAVADFTGAVEGDGKPKNTFTDAEYKKFQENLSYYPLNVRIAIEDLVVKNEFTDDAVFAVLEKVLRRAPVRQVASELEKMLDISLDVPRDFEKRSAQEYEAYKKSFEYQLKNRILPVAIVGTGAALVVAALFMLTLKFVVTPLKARSLYKQGYENLQANQYIQSEELFNMALSYKPVKKWFFTYAEGYRDHKQYDRAAKMYRGVIQRYKHDKQAGLDWADMEANELYNYEEAERILKREVLDYHVNDADALLQLGDTYLAWADDKDPSKYADAKEIYDELYDRYGDTAQSNKYLSRQMRYYIRTDNLRQVLAYKEYFYPLKKNGLEAEDLTDLSGYLLEKRYGQLKPSEESLRFSIEDVRDLLERAVKADPSNPVALYNMGRYFVEAGSSSGVHAYLSSAISAFAAQDRRNKKDTYRYINAYRLLGEQYRDEQEYILSEDNYNKGIAIFEHEREASGFESDGNVGLLYADLADLDYFVSGQMDSALANYINAVNNKNDTASVRYRIGYIQYTKQNYEGALGSFIRASETENDNTHVLLSLANTLSLRGDNYAAQGYYEHLLTVLNQEREILGILLPQVRDDQADLVDTYMKAANNLGVIQSRLAAATGNSSLNAKALVNLQESMRAWDALTRNQETMVRLEGSNLAEQNFKYITHPVSAYEPEIYTDIPRLLTGEKGFE